MKDYKVYLSPYIHEVTQVLYEAIQSDAALLEQASMHILQSGGKRVRPMFVLLSGLMGDEKKYDALLKTSASLELVHMASLVHDDYIDNSDKRRGHDAVHHAFGESIAIKTGHFVLAEALHLISDINDEKFHQSFANTILQVCYGELDQMNDRFVYPISMTTYLRRIKRKTAVLIEASCELGARSTNCEESVIYHLKRFGYYVGMSFQIIDDILDYISDEATLGKPAGSDLLNGHITLPLMITAKRDFRVHQLLSSICESQSITEAQLTEIIAKVRELGITESKRISSLFAEKAIQHLEQIPQNVNKDYLMAIHQKMLNRAF